VIGHLRDAQVPVVLIDLADLPGRATLTIDYASPRRPRLEYRRDGEPPLDLRAVRAFWWRRPQVADPAPITDRAVQVFAANEWQEAIAGLWQLVGGRWVNDPVRDEVAARKAAQLVAAAEVGLSVPRTLVTSDPAEARAFLDAADGQGAIFKTFSCTHEIWRETRLVRAHERELLEAVRLAPVIFQEYVPAEADVRVTIVGRQLYAASIDARATDYPVDFRMSLGQAEVAAATLPPDVGERLLALVDRLGLSYGAVDLRRTPAGEHVFLELNTAGEFLFVEERTGQPIASALADLLARPSARRPAGAPRRAAGRRRSSRSRPG
jgi:glutathione synthase/RimK-type ligase-like ATP-grasp enzyme